MPFATPVIWEQSGIMSWYRLRRIWCRFSKSIDNNIITLMILNGYQ